MNAYEQRIAKRKLLQKSVRNARIVQRLTHEDVVIRVFECAYESVHGIRPMTTVSSGYYAVRISGKTEYFREKDLVMKTRMLEATAHERELTDGTVSDL